VPCCPVALCHTGLRRNNGSTVKKALQWTKPQNEMAIQKYLEQEICVIIVKTSLKIACKGQTYKTAEVIYHKGLCLFCTVTYTNEPIAKRHSLSCHYQCDY